MHVVWISVELQFWKHKDNEKDVATLSSVSHVGYELSFLPLLNLLIGILDSPCSNATLPQAILVS